MIEIQAAVIFMNEAAAGKAREETFRIEAMLSLAAHGLLRLGEICALRVESFEVKEHSIAVGQSIGKDRKPTPPKLGPRVVALTPPLARLVSNLVEGKDEGDLVFQAPDGGPFGPETVRLRLKRSLSGSCSQVTFISARSAGIKALLDAGVSIDDVRFQIGLLRGLDAAQRSAAIKRIIEATHE